MAKCNDTEMLVHASCQKEQAEDGPKKGQANRARSARAKGRGDLELGNLENEQLQTPAPPTLVTSCSKTPRGSNRDEWAQESRIEGMRNCSEAVAVSAAGTRQARQVGVCGARRRRGRYPQAHASPVAREHAAAEAQTPAPCTHRGSPESG